MEDNMEMNSEDVSAPLIGIERHRLATDGVGVTTLVAFHGCPLCCKYCLNSQCLVVDGIWKYMTTAELLNEVKLDHLYFLATGGGITFGGGEPLLRSSFIREFCNLKPKEWHITVETSLNVARRHLEEVVAFVDEYIIDIKDMNEEIYREYTSISNNRVKENLKWLAEQGLADRACIRLPLIPDHNTDKERDSSEQELRNMGYRNFERFDYIKHERY